MDHEDPRIESVKSCVFAALMGFMVIVVLFQGRMHP